MSRVRQNRSAEGPSEQFYSVKGSSKRDILDALRKRLLLLYFTTVEATTGSPAAAQG